ncbi:hypothetical protein THAOC_37132, partial [Thalassiosira oceanica]
DLWVGYPAQRQTAVVDTGSSVTAFPCSGCGTSCGRHADPPFDERSSRSFRPVTCDPDSEASTSESVCVFGRCGPDGGCTIEHTFGTGDDASSWRAYEAQDVAYAAGPHDRPVEHEGSPSPDVVGDGPGHAAEFSFPLSFGCQTEVTGYFERQLASGVVGLDRRAQSFWGQMRSSQHGRGRDSGGDRPAPPRDGDGVRRVRRGGRYRVVQGQDEEDVPPGRPGEERPLRLQVEVPPARRRRGGAERGGDVQHRLRHDRHVPHIEPKRRVPEGVEGDHGPRLQQRPHLDRRGVGRQPVPLPHAGHAVPPPPGGRRGRPGPLRRPPDGPRPRRPRRPEPPQRRHGRDTPPELHAALDVPRRAGAVYTPRIYLDRDDGLGNVLGANFMTGHDVLFDMDRSRIGFAESGCDYAGLVAGGAAGNKGGGGSGGGGGGPSSGLKGGAPAEDAADRGMCSSMKCKGLFGLIAGRSAGHDARLDAREGPGGRRERRDVLRLAEQVGPRRVRDEVDVWQERARRRRPVAGPGVQGRRTGGVPGPRPPPAEVQRPPPRRGRVEGLVLLLLVPARSRRPEPPGAGTTPTASPGRAPARSAPAAPAGRVAAATGRPGRSATGRPGRPVAARATPTRSGRPTAAGATGRTGRTARPTGRTGRDRRRGGGGRGATAGRGGTTRRITRGGEGVEPDGGVVVQGRLRRFADASVYYLICDGDFYDRGEFCCFLVL